MSSSVKLVNHDEVVFKGKGPKKPAKNQANVKKLIIADPGVGFELQITETEFTNEVMSMAISVKLGPSATNYHHTTNIGIGVLNGKMDLSEPYVFVVPFVDPNFNRETGAYSFEINVSLYSNPDNAGEHHLVSIPISGSHAVPEVDRQKQFSCKLNGQSPTFINPLPTPLPELTGNNVAYYDILTHQLGNVFRVQFPASTKDKVNPVGIRSYLNPPAVGEGSETNMGLAINNTEANHGFDMTVETGFAFLPYPRTIGQALSIDNTRFAVNAYYANPENGIHFPLTNATYNSANPLTASTGELSLELS